MSLPAHAPDPAPAAPALVLGTVQLGLPYGIANRSGQPDEAMAGAILAEAAALGITQWDTARAYGEAEARIGKARAALPAAARARLEILTKLSPLSDLPADAGPAAVGAAVSASVEASRAALGQDRLDTLLLHRAAHLDSHGGAVWMACRALRSTGIVGRLGGSVQSPAEALRALAEPALTHIQLPLNLLDGRWAAAGVPEALAARPDCRVHVRSALLQGLIGGLDPALYARVFGADGPAVRLFVKEAVARFGRASPADLALAYVRALPFVHGIVVGAETLDQLRANRAAFAAPPLAPEARAALEAERPAVPAATLDPAQWSRP
ncbi:MAG: aldo/keto reductase [Alphaproteobacteria bacterium]|nr:aldo/keto reductase [Alphaproteobacteria bacterium]